ncbi:MAG: hypothetical protein HY700_04445 [Gemmatimonadetes bacterium]|nr:hypothetical protein [Gemmatimonadota bacterium]
MRISMAVATLAAVLAAAPALAQGRGAAAAPAGPAPLAGRWEGTFTNDITQKSGKLVLTLAGSDESASGQLMLTPVGAKTAISPEGAAAPAKGKAPAGGLLVNAMKSGDEMVTGSVDGSYVDPGCNCAVVSTFEGELQGNTIVGTISARDARTGQWNFTSFTATKGGGRR